METLTNDKRLTEIAKKIQDKYPNRKLTTFNTLSKTLSTISDDSEYAEDNDMLDDDSDIVDQYYVEEGDEPKPKRLHEHKEAQEDRIEIIHKVILSEAPSLFSRDAAFKSEINQKDMTDSGRTLLHKAAFKGNMMEVQRLCEDMDINLFLKDNSGMTAADLAFEEEHIDIARFLGGRMSMTAKAA